MNKLIYEKVDHKIIELIGVLKNNCKININYCCIKHNKSLFYIQFDDLIEDKTIHRLCKIFKKVMLNNKDNILLINFKKNINIHKVNSESFWILKVEIKQYNYLTLNLIDKLIYMLINEYNEQNNFDNIIKWLDNKINVLNDNDEYIFVDKMFPSEVNSMIKSIDGIIIEEKYDKNIKLIKFKYKKHEFLAVIDLNIGNVSIL